MFSELPKIFDRNFIVSYVLPSAAFLAFSLGFTHDADLAKIPTTWDGAAFAVAAFVIGIVALAANRSITRLLEGYGHLNPARIILRFQRWRFRRLNENIRRADDEFRRYRDRKIKIPDKLDVRRLRLMTRLAERYPDDEKLVLPTAFGNAVRAFECYPRVMYKLDVIEGWNRLIAVIPKDYLDLIDTAKAETDLWVNLWFLSLVAIVDSMVRWHFPKALPAGNQTPHLQWLATDLVPLVNSVSNVTMQAGDMMPYIQLSVTSLGAIGVALFASWMAARAAIEWGSMVKGATDVFLPTLYERLGFLPPSGRKDVEDRWDAFSDAIGFRIPKAMPERRWIAAPAVAGAPTTPPAVAVSSASVAPEASGAAVSAAAPGAVKASGPSTARFWSRIFAPVWLRHVCLLLIRRY